MQTSVHRCDLNLRIAEMFRLGMTKRELHSRRDKDTYILIENDKDNSSGFMVLLFRNEYEEAYDREFIYLGKNLTEEEALELAVEFAGNCNLF